jgi:uncharacterized protein (DUF433 family)
MAPGLRDGAAPERYQAHPICTQPGVSVMALNWQHSIEERNDVMLGKPVFKGTRLTVEHILRELGTGMGQDEIIENYPNLKPEHIQAALRYAAAVVSMDQCICQ